MLEQVGAPGCSSAPKFKGGVMPNAECMDAITKFVKGLCKDKYKAINYTSTFRYEFLKNQVVPVFENWLMQMYCAEDREPMTHQNQKFIDDLEIDRLAKEDEECRLEQKEGMLKNNIIPIRRTGDVGTSDDSI